CNQQPRSFDRRSWCGRKGFVFKAAEHAGTTHDGLPMRRHPQLDAAEDRIGFDRDLLALGSGATQIDFGSAEHHRDLTALKILRFDFLTRTAEDILYVQKIAG